MSRLPVLALVVLCAGLGGYRMLVPRDASRVSVEAGIDGCDYWECRDSHSLLTGMVSCSRGRIECGGERHMQSGEVLRCDCSAPTAIHGAMPIFSAGRAGCVATQSGLATRVACKTGMKLETGDLMICRCAD